MLKVMQILATFLTCRIKALSTYKDKDIMSPNNYTTVICVISTQGKVFCSTQNTQIVIF